MTKTKTKPPTTQAASALAQLLPGIANILYRLTHGMSCPDELSVPQFKTLQFIHAAGRDLKMNELSRMLGIASSTLTETVKKLTADGFIKRERSSKDDRVVLLALTAKGRRCMEDHMDNLKEFFTMVCQQSGSKNSRQLVKAHQYIHDTYQEILARQSAGLNDAEEEE
jgi:DNA-binding MarR family transcriptional regulator